MLETIKAQLKRPKVFCKQRYYMGQTTPKASYLAGDMYPLWQEYYHELNPGFLFKISGAEYLNFFPVMTVRDGTATFASFILKNSASLKMNSTHFIVHPDLARFVPPQMKSQFSSWTIVQEKQLPITEAKKILITAFVNTQTVPSLDKLQTQLEVLKQVPKDCQIELFLPIRNEPLSDKWKESQLPYKLQELILSKAQGRSVSYVNIKEIMDRASWNGIFCIDLMDDNLVMSDSYLNHFIAARGGSVSRFDSKNNKDAFFEFNLGLYHKLQISPLPEVESAYLDMIIYQKRATTTDYITDPTFHNLVRKK